VTCEGQAPQRMGEIRNLREQLDGLSCVVGSARKARAPSPHFL